MSHRAKTILRVTFGAALILFALAVIGVEIWHQHTLTTTTAGVAVGAGVFGGLLIDRQDMMTNVSTVIGWVREAIKGKPETPEGQ